MHIHDHLGRTNHVRPHISSLIKRWGWPDAFDRTFQAGLANGGPSGLVYGFLFAWIGNFLQALVMAELASMFVDLKYWRMLS